MKWELFSCEFWMVWPLFYHFVVKNFERSGPIFYCFVLEKFERPSPLFYHFGEENFEIGGKFKNCIFCFKEKMKNTGTSILNCCDLKFPISITINVSHNHSCSWSAKASSIWAMITRDRDLIGNDRQSHSFIGISGGCILKHPLLIHIFLRLQFYSGQFPKEN